MSIENKIDDIVTNNEANKNAIEEKPELLQSYNNYINVITKLKLSNLKNEVSSTPSIQNSMESFIDGELTKVDEYIDNIILTKNFGQLNGILVRAISLVNEKVKTFEIQANRVKQNNENQEKEKFPQFKKDNEPLFIETKKSLDRYGVLCKVIKPEFVSSLGLESYEQLSDNFNKANTESSFKDAKSKLETEYTKIAEQIHSHKNIFVDNYIVSGGKDSFETVLEDYPDLAIIDPWLGEGVNFSKIENDYKQYVDRYGENPLFKGLKEERVKFEANKKNLELLHKLINSRIERDSKSIGSDLMDTIDLVSQNLLTFQAQFDAQNELLLSTDLTEDEKYDLIALMSDKNQNINDLLHQLNDIYTQIDNENDVEELRLIGATAARLGRTLIDSPAKFILPQIGFLASVTDPYANKYITRANDTENVNSTKQAIINGAAFIPFIGNAVDFRDAKEAFFGDGVDDWSGRKISKTEGWVALGTGTLGSALDFVGVVAAIPTGGGSLAITTVIKGGVKSGFKGIAKLVGGKIGKEAFIKGTIEGGMVTSTKLTTKAIAKQQTGLKIKEAMLMLVRENKLHTLKYIGKESWDLIWPPSLLKSLKGLGGGAKFLINTARGANLDIGSMKQFVNEQNIDLSKTNDATLKTNLESYRQTKFDELWPTLEADLNSREYIDLEKLHKTLLPSTTTIPLTVPEIITSLKEPKLWIKDESLDSMVTALRKNENSINNYRTLYVPEKKIDLASNGPVSLSREIGGVEIKTILNTKISDDNLKIYIQNSDSYSTYVSTIKSQGEPGITPKELEEYAKLRWNEFHNNKFGSSGLDYTNPESIKQNFRTKGKTLDIEGTKLTERTTKKEELKTKEKELKVKSEEVVDVINLLKTELNETIVNLPKGVKDKLIVNRTINSIYEIENLGDNYNDVLKTKKRLEGEIETIVAGEKTILKNKIFAFASSADFRAYPTAKSAYANHTAKPLQIAKGETAIEFQLREDIYDTKTATLLKAKTDLETNLDTAFNQITGSSSFVKIDNKGNYLESTKEIVDSINDFKLDTKINDIAYFDKLKDLSTTGAESIDVLTKDIKKIEKELQELDEKLIYNDLKGKFKIKTTNINDDFLNSLSAQKNDIPDEINPQNEAIFVDHMKKGGKIGDLIQPNNHLNNYKVEYYRAKYSEPDFDSVITILNDKGYKKTFGDISTMNVNKKIEELNSEIKNLLGKPGDIDNTKLQRILDARKEMTSLEFVRQNPRISDILNLDKIFNEIKVNAKGGQLDEKGAEKLAMFLNEHKLTDEMIFSWMKNTEGLENIGSHNIKDSFDAIRNTIIPILIRAHQTTSIGKKGVGLIYNTVTGLWSFIRRK